MERVFQQVDSANFIRTAQEGLRCRVGDETNKRAHWKQCQDVARRYPGAHVLGDIDVCTGEFVYRVVMPNGSYSSAMSAVARRRRR